MRRDTRVRPTRSVFRELLISMLLFGTVIGVVFPPFTAVVLGIPEALAFRFFAMCMGAGITVGVANYFLFRFFVSRHMTGVVTGMRHINEAVAVAESTESGCTADCLLEVKSNDVVGDMVEAFNSMTEAIGSRIRTETTTRRLLAELSTTVDLTETSLKVLDGISGICDAAAGVIYVDRDSKLEYMASFAVDVGENLPKTLDVEHGLTAQCLSSGSIIHVSPEKDGYTWFTSSTPLGRMQPGGIVLIPLTAEQKAVGLVVVACPQDEITEAERDLLEAVRKQVAPYLATAIMHRKVEDLAAIDDLTRLLNRRFGVRRLGEEFSRSVRHGVPLSVIMLDIDDFKGFNDTFGHDAGDAVLIEVASVLEKSVRSGDVVCRYGGEELLIVAPGMGLNDAIKSAERLRRQIEATSVEWGGKALSITVSLGVASWPVAHASTPEEIIACADGAMYYAKEHGRNQVALNDGDRIMPASSLQKAFGPDPVSCACPQSDAAGTIDDQAASAGKAMALTDDQAVPADDPGVTGGGA